MFQASAALCVWPMCRATRSLAYNTTRYFGLCLLLLLRRCLCLVLPLKSFAELLYAPAFVNKLLLARIEGMAGRTNIQLYISAER